MNVVKTIIFSIKISLRGINYKLLFISVSLMIFFLLVLIPTISIPGNTFLYQLSLFSSLDLVITIFLSILYAVFVTIQVFSMRLKKHVRNIGTTVGGGVGALFAGVAGTAFCASCLAPLFALLGIGFGGVLFVLEYRFYFVAAIIILMLIAIYLTSVRISKNCST